MPRFLRFFLAASLLAGACSPAVTTARDAGPRRDPIVQPTPKPKPKIDRALLRAALAERRQIVFERFLEYREARVYPVRAGDGSEHIWVDAYNNLCAAATLISYDWGRDASVRVGQENNFVRFADIHDGELHDWLLTSGLTHHEIVAIQAPSIDPGGRVYWTPPEEQLMPDPMQALNEQLYQLYTDVERQLTSMWDESLDDATDALMERPDLARAMIDGVAAGPGHFGAKEAA